MSFKKARVRRLNDHPTNADGEYVLYWMQMARRMRCNHALDYALAASRTLGVPLVVYEGLRLDYPWASRRLHRFVLEGMRDNARDAMLLGGLRRCEVLGLRFADINAGERRVFIAEGKGGHQRIVPISSRFFNALAAYLADERPNTAVSDRVFVVLKARDEASR